MARDTTTGLDFESRVSINMNGIDLTKHNLYKYLKAKGINYKSQYTIWCPFDKEDSEYVKLISEAGHKVIFSHIDNGKNFFYYEPDEPYDYIISNPPFSIKDDVLKRLYELNKPYAILLPLPALQGQKRFEYLKDTQALIFDKRINFFKDKETKEILKGVSFASIYVCKNFLPNDLIYEKLPS